MFRETVMLVAALSSSAAVPTQQTSPLPVLEPAAVVARAESLLEKEPIRVRFRVAQVDTVNVTTADGASFTQIRLHPDLEWDKSVRKTFDVMLSPEVERTLKRIGITDLPAHFKSKVIDVQGRLHRTGLHIKGAESAWDYHIVIRGLDQVHSVSAPTASAGL